jgi:hypothetical protein
LGFLGKICLRLDELVCFERKEKKGTLSRGFLGCTNGKQERRFCSREDDHGGFVQQGEQEPSSSW